MKLLERYIVTEFLKLLALAVVSFVLVFILFDLFENMDNLMKFNVPVLASVVFFLYKVPFIIGQISPVSVLVAVLISLGILAKHNEITAVKAGGVRVLRVIVPLLLIGAVISVAVMLMNEYVTPTALKKVDGFRKQWFGVQESSFGKEGMWVKSGAGIINIRRMDVDKNRLNGVTVYVIEKPFRLKERVSSRTVKWRDGRWVADMADIWSFASEAEAVKRLERGYVIEGLAPPEDLLSMESLQKNMGFFKLRQYIKNLEAEGYESTRYRIDLYGKVAFPFVNFIMVLVGIPFALKTGRHSGIATGVGLSVVIAFSYWIVFALTRSLGQSGAVPPLVASAFPDVLFLAIGTLMLGYVRE
ncbi:MAG: LPS export ABC transporter permease LptG [Thermodesulfobacteriota bacterium]